VYSYVINNNILFIALKFSFDNFNVINNNILFIALKFSFDNFNVINNNILFIALKFSFDNFNVIYSIWMTNISMILLNHCVNIVKKEFNNKYIFR
jgi:hypothetical protein